MRAFNEDNSLYISEYYTIQRNSIIYITSLGVYMVFPIKLFIYHILH